MNQGLNYILCQIPAYRRLNTFSSFNHASVPPVSTLIVIAFLSITTIYCINRYLFTQQYLQLIYTSQVNSAFRARWVVKPEVNSKYFSTQSSRWDKVARQEFISNHFLVCWKKWPNLLVSPRNIIRQLSTSVSLKWWIFNSPVY